MADPIIEIPMTNERLIEIQKRAATFWGEAWPMQGEPISAFWIDRDDGATLTLKSAPFREALKLAQQDVPELFAEIMRLRREREVPRSRARRHQAEPAAEVGRGLDHGSHHQLADLRLYRGNHLHVVFHHQILDSDFTGARTQRRTTRL
jgi:hypothetical protein